MLRLALLSLLVPLAARASVPDVFGLGSEESGVGGASVARVHDFSAAWYNPAGLTRLEQRETSLGVIGFGARLTVDGAAPRGIAEPWGIVLGAATPVPFGGVLRDRIYIAVALFLLPDTIVREIAHVPDEPFFPYYDNRTQRLVVLPAIAVRIGWGLSVGIGANYLAGLAGQVQASEGATRAVEARVDEQIFSVLRVNAGLLWRSPRDRLAIGLSYRQAFSVPFSTVTNNNVAGQPIDLSVDAEGLYQPHELTVGAALRARPWLLLSLDLEGAFWSDWRGPYVAVQSTLPLVGGLSSALPKIQFRDVIGIRAGAEARRPLAARLDGVLRLGYGFESSPVPDQPGVTNLLDAPKHFVSAGAGLVYTFARAERGKHARLRLDAHGQLQILQTATLTKQVAPPGTSPDPAAALRDEVPDDPMNPATLGAQISNPGYPRITGGGFAWAASLTLTVER